MSWKAKLQRASFRGVPFHVQGSSGELAGRRAAVHEYPGRDESYAEDMGGKAREFSATAYLLGQDCFKQRDQLIDACSRPGPGTFVHPSLGSKRVLCTGCSVSEQRDAGRMVTVSLSFVDASGNAQPKGTVDTAARVTDVSDAYAAAAQDSFLQRYSIAKLPGWALSDVQGVAASLARAAGVPALDCLDGAALLGGLADGVKHLGFDAAVTFAKTCAESVGIPPLTAIGKRVGTLCSDMQNIARRTGIAQAATLLSQGQFASRNDAVGAFGVLDELVDVDLDMSSVMCEDSVFFAAQDLRAACVADISARAANLPALKQAMNIVTEPALVSAYRHAGSAQQAFDLMQRNSVKHSGFVPGGEILEVLNG